MRVAICLGEKASNGLESCHTSRICYSCCSDANLPLELALVEIDWGFKTWCLIFGDINLPKGWGRIIFAVILPFFFILFSCKIIQLHGILILISDGNKNILRSYYLASSSLLWNGACVNSRRSQEQETERRTVFGREN